MALLLLSAFIFGALTVVAAEAVGLWILIRRLSQKAGREESKAAHPASVSSPGDLSPSLYDKQGAIWILVPDKVSKLGPEDKGPTDQRRKKEIFEVTPVRKYARIRDRSLVLMESDGSFVEILLRGVEIVAVSATSLASRKCLALLHEIVGFVTNHYAGGAKRYPIKMESKDSAVYKGYKVIYIYLETSWEKESWCKALRFASCNDKERITWFSKLSVEFHHYLASLNAGYPSFMKPSSRSSRSNVELIDKSVKFDSSSSKVRQFLKKLTKKASKSGQDYKGNGASISGREKGKFNENSRSFQDLVVLNDSAKIDTAGKVPNMFSDDASIASSISTSNETGAESHLSRNSDTNSKHKCSDEGSLCLNMLISRLFFDVKDNLQIKSSIQNRIQRGLANMRIPSYIGEVTCTSVDLGSLPPHILAMRVLPSNMNELWSLEIDVEYLGGTVLEFATRLEIQELEETRNAGEVTSDLLEGFEYLGEQLKLSEEVTGGIKQNDEGYHDKDETENSKSTVQASSQGSRWKSMLHSITKQVSQVSISLGMRVSSLSGTIQLCMKPPPSDQIWFGFTSMPDIQFNLDSFVGDHKITNGHLALFLIGRFKAGIRETLVLPNRESVAIPWMLAEKDDWVPRNVAPFMWYRNNQDSTSNSNNNITKQEVPGFTKSEVNQEKSKNVNRIPGVISEHSDSCASASSSMDESTSNDGSFRELEAPLLNKGRTQDLGTTSVKEDKPDTRMHSPPRVLTERQLVHSSDDDDSKLRKIGTRERMRGLGKKMGEKLEVKRRNLEEKGRSFVERIRAPP
ncbi:hypothetical protein CASFOL_013054 [Castilleja foliolosa]|uniref:SMP-LTD domain-containing protein n=1 Tax=Castilleja foliolosa TaxID=1961234 RepID=A0ABD3DK60_9LAMI